MKYFPVVPRGIQRTGRSLQRRHCPGKEGDLRHNSKDGIEFGLSKAKKDIPRKRTSIPFGEHLGSGQPG